MKTLTLVTLAVLSTNFALAQTKPRPLGTAPDSIRTEKIKIAPQLDVSKSVQLELSKELRSTGGGNGGFISQMREASLLASHPLTAKELREILALDGKEIKDQLIYPLINSVTPVDIEDNKVSAMWKAMLENEVKLKDNVRFTRMEEGKCPTGYDLCTDDRPYSTIYFDVAKIVKNKTSLAELAGMVMHEFSHHYVGEADHPNYGMALWFQQRVTSGPIGKKTFSIRETLIKINDGSLIGLAAGHWTQKVLSSIDNFCRTKKFSQMENYIGVRVGQVSKTLGLQVNQQYFVKKTNIREAPFRNEVENFTRFQKFMAENKIVSEITCK